MSRRKKRVLVTDYAWPDLDVEHRILPDSEIVVPQTGTERELIDLVGDVDAILTNWTPVNSAILKSAKRCITVARYGVGLDNIDIATASALGIVVTNVPDFCTAEVADHTLALLLALERKLVPFASQTSSGGWNNAEFGTMRRLGNLTLGLIGYGAIAQEVARRAQAFGIAVVAYSPSRIGAEPADSVTFTRSLRELLSVSNAISLHLPATEQTRGLIGAKELAYLPRGAILINTSRGALVDETSLIEALSSGSLAGAGLDVLGSEPPTYDNRLRSLPNVILTPHAAFLSVDSVAELQTKAARNVAWVLDGKVPEWVVNTEVLRSPELRAQFTT